MARLSKPKVKFASKSVAMLLLLCLAGCKRRERITDQDRLRIRVSQAQLSDITLPIGAKPVMQYVQEGAFGCLVSQPVADLLDFYIREIGLLGWRKVGQFAAGGESQLVFIKPHRIITVSLRPSGKSTLVLILLADR